MILHYTSLPKIPSLPRPPRKRRAGEGGGFSCFFPSKIHNCVVWQGTNGAVFQFGWFPKTCGNVSVSNIDVIHFENWYGVHQVNRAVFNYANTRGRGEIRGIDFSNIHIEGKVLRLFGFHCGNQTIRDFSFTNLTCDGMGVGNLGPPGENYFGGDISDWTFNDFVFDGKPVAEPSQAHFEFTDGAGNGFVFNVNGNPISPRHALHPVRVQRGTSDKNP